jgi:hypothetical protein
VCSQLCNSVSLLVPQSELRGESWESRAALGLRAWVHYVPVTADNAHICENIEGTVMSCIDLLITDKNIKLASCR